MSHKRAVEALDRTLQNLKDNTKIMKGVTLFLAGDFRQILPDISWETRADQIKPVWKGLISEMIFKK